MGLVLPTVGSTLGPEWATELNAAFDVVDAHNHTPGNGVPVPTNGISLNGDLPFNGYNATLLRSVRMSNQSTPLSGVTDLTCLYVSGNNLYYNNGVGNQVQITAGAGLDASTVGGFGGDYGTSTASAFYTSATSTFTFWSAPNVSALMDTGAITIHPSNSHTLGVTLLASTSLSSSYNLTLPVSLPASTKILTVDSSGNVGDVYDVDNATLTVSSNTLEVAPLGIQRGNIANGAVGPVQLSTPNWTISGTSGTFSTSQNGFVTPVPNTATSIGLSGYRLVMCSIQSDNGAGGTGEASIRAVSSGGNTSAVGVYIIKDGNVISEQLLGQTGTGGITEYSPASITFIDSSFSSGTSTYQIGIKCVPLFGSPQTVSINAVKLLIAEL
jgi:hypothetical protein